MPDMPSNFQPLATNGGNKQNAFGTGAMTAMYQQGSPLTWGSAALVLVAPLSLTCNATARDPNAVDAVMPALALSVYCGSAAQLTVGAASVASTGTVLAVCRTDAKLPAPLVTAGGTTGGLLAARCTLRGGLSVSSSSGAVTVLRLRNRLSASASGLGGGVARAKFSAPRATLTTSSTRDNFSRLSVALPALRPAPSAVLRAKVPAATLQARVR